ncbi:MAG: RlmE family RNA methyltransferase [Candidatus Bathyarchaeota archaeon]|jgi:23S rRNA (uridine2552-2'-O)-methyltransferase
MSGRWLNERRKDPYYRRAKDEGYRSRAAYKLKQLNDRFGFLDGARRVLDLGAAPGGWLQVASESLPEDGIVLGVDLDDIKPLGLPNVRTLVGDATEGETQREILDILSGKADVVLSDMAPDVSGAWDLDQYRQIYLARVALVLADRLLEEDGWFIVKTFEGSEHVRYVRDVKAVFKRVKIVKPKASRRESAENFIVAHLLKERRRLPEEFRKDT